MKSIVVKPEKISLCRECKGTGTVTAGKMIKKTVVCPQCEGSGRVLVACIMELDVRPYKA